MRIKVIWFGRPAASPYEAQIDTYRQRVDRRWPAEDRGLRAATGRQHTDLRRLLSMEADKVRRQVPGSWWTVALDERGKQLDSVAFARYLGDLEAAGTPGVAFCLGSDVGLDQDLCRQARLRLSLSPMTLPHLLARLCLWEQLFRATDILGSGRYHRLGVQ